MPSAVARARTFKVSSLNEDFASKPPTPPASASLNRVSWLLNMSSPPRSLPPLPSPLSRAARIVRPDVCWVECALHSRHWAHRRLSQSFTLHTSIDTSLEIFSSQQSHITRGHRGSVTSPRESRRTLWCWPHSMQPGLPHSSRWQSWKAHVPESAPGGMITWQYAHVASSWSRP